jgi:hypothetical protein
MRISELALRWSTSVASPMSEHNEPTKVVQTPDDIQTAIDERIAESDGYPVFAEHRAVQSVEYAVEEEDFVFDRRDGRVGIVSHTPDVCLKNYAVVVPDTAKGTYPDGSTTLADVNPDHHPSERIAVVRFGRDGVEKRAVPRTRLGKITEAEWDDRSVRQPHWLTGEYYDDDPFEWGDGR